MKDLNWMPFIIVISIIISLWSDKLDVLMIGLGLLLLLLLCYLLLLVLYFKFSSNKWYYWDLELNGVQHKVKFMRSLIKTNGKVIVNDELQKNIKVIIDNHGADYYFRIEDYQCVILVRSHRGIWDKVDLAVEGQSIKTKEQVNFISKKNDKSVPFKNKIKILFFDFVSIIVALVMMWSLDYLLFSDNILFVSSRAGVIFYTGMVVLLSKFVRGFFN